MNTEGPPSARLGRAAKSGMRPHNKKTGPTADPVNSFSWGGGGTQKRGKPKGEK